MHNFLDWQTLTALLAVTSVFTGIIVKMYFASTATNKETHGSMWRRIDENRDTTSQLKTDIAREQCSKEEMKEFVLLSQKPILDSLNHLGVEMGEVKSLINNSLVL